MLNDERSEAEIDMPVERAAQPRVTQVDHLLGRRVRELRRQRGISQAVLAARIGVTFQQVQKYERGINRVSVATFLRIAEVLSIPPERLIADLEGGEQLPVDARLFSEVAHLLDLFAAIRDPAWRKQVLALVETLSIASRAAR